MFVELTQKEYEKLSDYLYDNGISREASDCTIPGEKTQHVHVEFGELTNEQIDGINQMIIIIRNQLLKETGSVEEKNMDVDGDGRADYLEELDAEEERKSAGKSVKRKKRDTTMNPVTAAKDYFFGTDEKEME